MSDLVLKKIDEKIDKVLEEIVEIKVIQAKHDVNLELHMEASKTLKSIYDDLKDNHVDPLKADMNQLKGGYKLLAGMGIIATLGMFIIKLLGK